MIIIYSKNNCPWCDKAKSLLKDKNLEYKELNLENGDFTRDELLALVGPNKPLTVPQIIIHNQLVGGFEALQQYMEEHNIYGVQN